ncbi:hypothetical protein C0Q70_19656 [Pomacea canaliculata]|uniref:VTT domain-containing protein n=1 Tax=Pomacea canaliculata TaxID=400727 RepID=A0A2T7NJZ1_POMCA|nr:hypothetical protein C0Q70_19656 [Pomacea canaliculata]
MLTWSNAALGLNSRYTFYCQIIVKMSKFIVSPAMLIGEPSKIDELFLPSSLRPASLAHELCENLALEAEMGLSKHGSDQPTREEMKFDDTTRIIVDALVKTPNATTRWYQASFTSIIFIIAIILFLFFGRSYIHALLMWLQEADLVVGLIIFTLLFCVVSFPLFWGYSLLLLAAGYLYGFILGPLVSLVCCVLGLLCANLAMRNICRTYFMDKFYSSKVESIIQLLNGSSRFKIVALSRLTPVPFGLQNALFSLADIGHLEYLLASAVGLAPMAALNCYMGSTLRTMEDIMTDQTNQWTGYFIFIGQGTQ